MLELSYLALLPLRDVKRTAGGPAGGLPVSDSEAETPSNLANCCSACCDPGPAGIIARAIDELLRLKARPRQPVDTIELRLDALEGVESSGRLCVP